MSEIPQHLKYTKDHEWAETKGDVVTVGITAYAVEQLGDVTLVDLPAVGTKTEAGKRFGDIESVKTVSELFAPITGEIIEVNAQLADKPELVNESPFGSAWMVRIRASNASELNTLLDAKAYGDFLGSLDH